MKPNKALAGVVLVLLLAAVLSSARVRATAFGAWGYSHLTTLGEKIRLINDPMKGWAWDSGKGELICLGGRAEHLPHSGEWVEVTSIDPIRLSLILRVRDPVATSVSETRMPLEPLYERTFRYDSRQYPISLTVRVIGVLAGESDPLAQLVIKAEPK